MRFVFHILAAVGLGLPFLAAPAAGRAHGLAAEVENARYTMASAAFNQASPTPHLINRVNIAGYDWFTRPAGKPTRQLTANILLFQYDQLTGASNYLAGGQVSLPAEALVIDNQLKHASLDASVVLGGPNGQELPVELHIEWRGVGEVTRIHQQNHFTQAGYRTAGASVYWLRAAQAAGRVRLEGVDFVSGAASLGRLLSAPHDLALTVNHAEDGSLPVRTAGPSDLLRQLASPGLAGSSGDRLFKSRYAGADLQRAAGEPGCAIHYTAILGVFDETSLLDSPAWRRRYVGIILIRDSQCSQTPSLFAYRQVDLEREALALSGAAPQVSLDLSLTMTDQNSGAAFPVEIHLAWSGSGPLSRYSYHFMSNGPDGRWSELGRTTTQPAQVTGSLTALGVEFLDPEQAYGELNASDLAYRTMGR